MSYWRCARSSYSSELRNGLAIQRLLSDCARDSRHSTTRLRSSFAGGTEMPGDSDAGIGENGRGAQTTRVRIRTWLRSHLRVGAWEIYNTIRRMCVESFLVVELNGHGTGFFSTAQAE